MKQLPKSQFLLSQLSVGVYACVCVEYKKQESKHKETLSKEDKQGGMVA